MKNRLVSILLTICILACMFGVTATAEEAVTGTISEDTVWENGTVVGDVTICGDVTITVNGTVTVAGTIRLNPDVISHVTFQGSSDAKLIRGGGFTGQMFYAEGASGNFHSLCFKNMILDGGAVWTGEVDKTLNRGTVNEGVKSTGSVLYLLYTDAILESSILQNHDDSTGEKANAVFLRYYSTIGFNNSVVKNNSSISAYYRGGVVTIRQGGTVTTNNTEVYGNSGAAGGFVGISSTGSYGGIVKVYNSKFHNNYADNGAVFLMQCNSKIGYLLIDGCEFCNNASENAVLSEWAYRRPFIIKDTYFHDNECAVWDCHADPVLSISGKFIVKEDPDYTKYLFETPLALGGALAEGSSVSISEASMNKLKTLGIVSDTAEYHVTEADLGKFDIPDGYNFKEVDVQGDGINDFILVTDGTKDVQVTVYDNFPGSDASEKLVVPENVVCLPALNFAHTGFAFDGWMTASDGAEKIDAQKFTEPVALYARWAIETPSLKLSRDGAVLTATIQNKYEEFSYNYQWYQDDVKIEGANTESLVMTDLVSHKYKCEVTVSKTGFAPVTVNVSATSSAPAVAQIGEAKFSSLSAAVEAANIAEGEVCVELLTDCNVSAPISVANHVTIIGSDFKVDAAEGFSGMWFIETDAGELSIISGTYGTDPSQWVPDAYAVRDNGDETYTVIDKILTVTFDSNGGSDVDPQYVPYNGTAIEPEEPRKFGSKFNGWYLNEDVYDFASPVLTDLTLEARWIPVLDILTLMGGAVCPCDGYADVDVDAWYHEAVDYVLETGLMNGVGEDTFAPNGTMTRAMVWTVLGRMAGQEFDGIGANWYTEAQNWAILAGVSDGTNPNGAITREELVTMLWRFVGSPTAIENTLQWYDDEASVSDWAADAMNWAVECRIIEGSNWKLNPQATALRAQVAAILMRYCG